MTTKEARAGRVNTPPKDSYRVYHADLIAQLEGDPGKLFLLHAIAHFRWDHETPRDHWESYWNVDKRAPDHDRDHLWNHDYWDRVWNMRNKARRVIQGAEPWPRWALRWRAFQELRYYHGRRKRPAWLDAPDDDAPRGIQARLASARRARRKAVR